MQCGGFQFLLILEILGISFHAVVVFVRGSAWSFGHSDPNPSSVYSHQLTSYDFEFWPKIWKTLLTGEHVYFETGRSTSTQTLTFTISSSTSGTSWKARISQIECGASYKYVLISHIFPRFPRYFPGFPCISQVSHVFP